MPQSSDTPYFYTESLMGSLSPEEARHCHKVLRLQIGDPITLTDGCGNIHQAKLTEVGPREVSYHIVETHTFPTDFPYPLHIAIAPTKSIDRIEWLAEKLVEVGLTSLSIVTTSRTVRKSVNAERLRRIFVSAIKQSHKAWLPKLHFFDSTRAYLQSLPPSTEPAGRFIAYCDDCLGKEELSRLFTPAHTSYFLIGPEGDFTPDEVEDATAHGFLSVSLGEARLRTETAGLYVGMLHHILNSR